MALLFDIWLFMAIFLLRISRDQCADIIGGRESIPHSRPYMAIINVGEQLHCGGTLIKPNWVLTAAHCKSNGTVKVILGAHSRKKTERSKQTIAVAKQILHPGFISNTLDNDLMLLKLKRSAKVNRYVSIIKLTQTFGDIKAGTQCLVAGWGRIHKTLPNFPDTLQEVNVTVIDRGICSDHNHYDSHHNITKNMVCAGDKKGGKDSCECDSGGPLICNGEQKAVVSFGKGCADSRYPGVYARLGKDQLEWIRRITRGYLNVEANEEAIVAAERDPSTNLWQISRFLTQCTYEKEAKPTSFEYHIYMPLIHGVKQIGARMALLFDIWLFMAIFLLGISRDQCTDIIGGRESIPHSRPFMAIVQGNDSCGGTLINPNWVLTAAHCYYKGTMKVMLGAHSRTKAEHSKQIIAVAKKIPHPGYIPEIFDNDLMLLKLERSAKINRYVSIIKLTQTSADIKAGTRCLVAGWGRIHKTLPIFPDTLQEVNVIVLDRRNCSNYRHRLTMNMVCAGDKKGGKGSCRGDSGGPLICNGEQKGVVSFGGEICENIRFPGVYARLGEHQLAWIRKITRGHL
ncbi:transmembrane protease serine 9-like [Anolis sagrei]|uniref:transmembrane protease serine 9-like n=1 Tax=Anolis sagrei TaxID=38937 RepID=UPI003520A53F